MRGISLVILFMIYVMGGFIAYYNQSWWTFFSAVIGLAAYSAFESLYLWLAPKIVFPKKTKEVFRYFSKIKYLIFSLSSLFISNKDKQIELYLATLRIIRLSKYLWKVHWDNAKETSYNLIFCAIAISPMFYIRWIVIGFLVMEISESVSIHAISPRLDFYLGLLICISFFKESLSEKEKSCISNAEITIHSTLQDNLNKVNPEGRVQELSVLRNAVRKKEYAIQKISSTSWMLLVNFWSLTIVFIALFYVSIPGALLAGASVAYVLLAMTFSSFEHEIELKSISLLKAKKSILSLYLEDPRMNFCLQRIATPLAIANDIQRLGKKILNFNVKSKEEFNLLRVISRLVFFTIFSLSILFPVMSIRSGGMSVRLVILYAFSMMSLWYSIGTFSTRISQLYKLIFELNEVEDAVKLLKKDGLSFKIGKDKILDDSKDSSTELKLNIFTWGLPWQKLVLKNTKEIVIPSTIGDSVRAIVFGKHKRVLLSLLSGETTPLSGEITLAGDLVEKQKEKIVYVPDVIPRFESGKIIDLFDSILDHRYFDLKSDDSDTNLKIVEKILSKFSLLSDLKIKGREEYTGGNLLLGPKGKCLDDDQNRLLFLSLNYALISSRMNDLAYNPKLIILDGIDRLSSLQLRMLVSKLFLDLANELHATLIRAGKDERDLFDREEYVLAISPRIETVPERLTEEEEKEISVISFGKDLDLREHVDRRKREAYLSYLKSLYANS